MYNNLSILLFRENHDDRYYILCTGSIVSFCYNLLIDNNNKWLLINILWYILEHPDIKTTISQIKMIIYQFIILIINFK